jgi:hypothetical protein
MQFESNVVTTFPMDNRAKPLFVSLKRIDFDLFLMENIRYIKIINVLMLLIEMNCGNTKMPYLHINGSFYHIKCY